MLDFLNSYKDCFVTFVGSRKITREGLAIGLQAKDILIRNVRILRSGNALGFDQIVSMYVPNQQKELYLPYAGFGPFLSKEIKILIPDTHWTTYEKAKEMVWKYHPVHEKLPKSILSYLIRDVYQVLGKDLNHPSDVVVCWTPDGATCATMCTRQTGGTAMAIRIADAHGIPVFNLCKGKD